MALGLTKQRYRAGIEMAIGRGEIAAVILAGGQSRRMGGGDKGLLPFGAGTVIGQVIARLSPQVGRMAINANGDPARFAEYGLPVLPDGLPGHPGPLAGVLAALDWAILQGADWVVTVPSDTPFLPIDLVIRLVQAVQAGAPLAIAASAGHFHPTCGLWPVQLRGDLAATLQNNQRKLRDFTDRHGAVAVSFPSGPPDPFFNINTPADLAQAQNLEPLWL